MDDLLMHATRPSIAGCSSERTPAPSDGRRVKISGFEEWSIGDDGLIASSLGHCDQAEYERQLDRA